ncbi:hypothetical protein [uncultured Roseobacter sp.]|uniref:hypothetical protein n=1 Tax=uncultured Roseobacter sp. TaxID=114847 RepID=UPI00261F3302|nr:hypothetical protein [uncultured Roseobacter sp.]
MKIRENMVFYTFPRLIMNDEREWSTAGILEAAESRWKALLDKSAIGEFDSAEMAAVKLNELHSDIDADLNSTGWSKRVLATISVLPDEYESGWW